MRNIIAHVIFLIAKLEHTQPNKIMRRLFYIIASPTIQHFRSECCVQCTTVLIGYIGVHDIFQQQVIKFVT